MAARKRKTPRRKGSGIYLYLVVLCMVNFIAHLAFFPFLPVRIPTHWGAGGVDGYGPRSAALILDLLPLGMLVVFRVIPLVDPNMSASRRFRAIYNGFITGITVFMAAFSWITEATAFGLIREKTSLPLRLVILALGFAWLILGSCLPSIPYNRSFGIRTPWTLADPLVWKKTHRLGRKVLMVTGSLLIVCGMMTSVLGGASFWIMLVLVTVPALYLVYRSYRFASDQS